MSNLMREIQSIAERFDEIDRQLATVKLTNKFRKWEKKIIPHGQRTDSKTFKLTLWKGTDKEEVFYQSITKLYESNRIPLPKHLAKRLVEIERLDKSLNEE